MAPTDDVGPTLNGRPSISTAASPAGLALSIDDVGDLGELPPGQVARGRRAGVIERRHRNHRQTHRLGVQRHLDDDAVDPGAREDQECVAGVELDLLQNDPPEPVDLLEEHGLAQAVWSDDPDVVRDRELGDRVKAGEAADPREHLLGIHPRVTGAEYVHEPVRGDRPGKEVGRLLDGIQLRRLESVEHGSCLAEPPSRGIGSGLDGHLGSSEIGAGHASMSRDAAMRSDDGIGPSVGCRSDGAPAHASRTRRSSRKRERSPRSRRCDSSM